MIDLHISVQNPLLDLLNNAIGALDDAVDRTNLGETLKAILFEGNKRDREAALDRDGTGTIPGLRRKRRGSKYGGATGDPLVPHHDRSRAIANFETQVVETGEGLEIYAGWSGDVAHLIAQAQNPPPGCPERDIMGVSDRTMEELYDACEQIIGQAFSSQFGGP